MPMRTHLKTFRTLQTAGLTAVCVTLCLAACAVYLTACGAQPAEDASPSSAVEPAESQTAMDEGAAEATAKEADAVDAPLVVFLGDSLTAGYGLDEEQAFPALVEERFAAEGRPIKVVNAGISGDTTAGGLHRLDWLLRQKPDILMVCLGANDGLRGVDLASSEENLRQIITLAKAKGVQVLLVGMLIPPNYGPDYSEQFAALYPKLATELDVPLLPFLLEGVAADPDLNLADGIHPNAEGHAILATTVMEALEPILAKRMTLAKP